MNELFSLQKAEIAAISDDIIKYRTQGLRSTDQPNFYIAGGQPGCGKTELINIARNREQDNLLICNADDLRNFHPDVRIILSKHEEKYPDITWPYANEWNNSLKSYGITNKMNVLIETTLRNETQVLEQFRQMKASGYRTNLFLLAVPARLSWVGTCLRYETMKATKGFGRRVSFADHDDRFDNLVKNVPAIVNSSHIDNIEVFARSKQLDNDADAALELLTKNKNDAVNKFSNEMNRKADYNDIGIFFKQVSSVSELMKKRGATIKETEEFDARVKMYKDNF